MGLLNLKALLSHSKNLKELWGGFCDFFFEARWLTVKGGRVQGSATGIVIDFLADDVESNPFSASIKKEDKVEISKGLVEIGDVTCAYPFPDADGNPQESFEIDISSTTPKTVVLVMTYSSNLVNYNGVQVYATFTVKEVANDALPVPTATSIFTVLAKTTIVDQVPTISYSRNRDWERV